MRRGRLCHLRDSKIVWCLDEGELGASMVLTLCFLVQWWQYGRHSVVVVVILA